MRLQEAPAGFLRLRPSVLARIFFIFVSAIPAMVSEPEMKRKACATAAKCCARLDKDKSDETTHLGELYSIGKNTTGDPVLWQEVARDRRLGRLALLC